MLCRHPGPVTHAGTSLIEVLVTVTVLSLGAVAMAGLQTTALKLGQSAYQRSQAVSLSYQILDAMRSNRQAALAGGYDWRLGDPPMASVPVTPLAQRDLQLWLRAVASALEPYNGLGGVARTENHFEVTIRWEDRYTTERAGHGEVHFERFSVVAEL